MNSQEHETPETPGAPYVDSEEPKDPSPGTENGDAPKTSADGDVPEPGK